ncbi:MAG: hypothetical protein JRD89_01195 [Deltaproteobacteria bacterium]|nr:hypothetical protein [Deltaproteobacteria bacterium]
MTTADVDMSVILSVLPDVVRQRIRHRVYDFTQFRRRVVSGFPTIDAEVDYHKLSKIVNEELTNYYLILSAIIEGRRRYWS